jgi:hypothetical protein
MNCIYTALERLCKQIKKNSVKLQKNIVVDTHKITDDNQAIKNGVINETDKSDLRSASKPRSSSRRKPSTKRKD